MPTVEELQSQVNTLQAALTNRTAEIAARQQQDTEGRLIAIKLRKVDAEMECLRMAHQTLIETKRSKPVEERGITSEEIANLKSALLNSVSSLQDLPDTSS